MLLHAARVALAWLVGAAVAYALASVAHTQTVLAGLVAVGAEIDPATRLGATLDDLAGLWRWGVVAGLSIGLGLAIVRLATFARWRRRHGLVLAALAGALGVAAALLAMRLAFGFSPIASARGAVGFAAQCLAGAAGGVAFRLALDRLGGRAGRADPAAGAPPAR